MTKGKTFLLTSDAQRLARWLRLLGYDTKMLKGISLLKIIHLAKRENRVIITRSKTLLNHPLDFEMFFIHSESLEDQLLELKALLKFDEQRIFSRCPIDNSLLVNINKEKIVSSLPPRIYNEKDDFKICSKCGRVYWQGSHYQRIYRKLKTLFSE